MPPLMLSLLEAAQRLASLTESDATVALERLLLEKPLSSENGATLRKAGVLVDLLACTKATFSPGTRIGAFEVIMAMAWVDQPSKEHAIKYGAIPACCSAITSTSPALKGLAVVAIRTLSALFQGYLTAGPSASSFLRTGWEELSLSGVFIFMRSQLEASPSPEFLTAAAELACAIAEVPARQNRLVDCFPLPVFVRSVGKAHDADAPVSLFYALSKNPALRVALQGGRGNGALLSAMEAVATGTSCAALRTTALLTIANVYGCDTDHDEDARLVCARAGLHDLLVDLLARNLAAASTASAAAAAAAKQTARTSMPLIPPPAPPLGSAESSALHTCTLAHCWNELLDGPMPQDAATAGAGAGAGAGGAKAQQLTPRPPHTSLSGGAGHSSGTDAAHMPGASPPRGRPSGRASLTGDSGNQNQPQGSAGSGSGDASGALLAPPAWGSPYGCKAVPLNDVMYSIQSLSQSSWGARQLANAGAAGPVVQVLAEHVSTLMASSPSGAGAGAGAGQRAGAGVAVEHCTAAEVAPVHPLAPVIAAPWRMQPVAVTLPSGLLAGRTLAQMAAVESTRQALHEAQAPSALWTAVELSSDTRLVAAAQAGLLHLNLWDDEAAEEAYAKLQGKRRESITVVPRVSSTGMPSSNPSGTNSNTNQGGRRRSVREPAVPSSNGSASSAAPDAAGATSALTPTPPPRPAPVGPPGQHEAGEGGANGGAEAAQGETQGQQQDVAVEEAQACEFPVFISHLDTETRALAWHVLYPLMVLQGWGSYIDLEPRHLTQADLCATVRTCATLLMVLSDHALDNPALLHEVQAAVDGGLRVVVVIPEGARWPDATGRMVLDVPSPDLVDQRLPPHVAKLLPPHTSAIVYSASSSAAFEAFVNELLPCIATTRLGAGGVGVSVGAAAADGGGAGAGAGAGEAAREGGEQAAAGPLGRADGETRSFAAVGRASKGPAGGSSFAFARNPSLAGRRASKPSRTTSFMPVMGGSVTAGGGVPLPSHLPLPAQLEYLHAGMLQAHEQQEELREELQQLRAQVASLKGTLSGEVSELKQAVQDLPSQILNMIAGITLNQVIPPGLSPTAAVNVAAMMQSQRAAAPPPFLRSNTSIRENRDRASLSGGPGDRLSQLLTQPLALGGGGQVQGPGSLGRSQPSSPARINMQAQSTVDSSLLQMHHLAQQQSGGSGSGSVGGMMHRQVTAVAGGGGGGSGHASPGPLSPVTMFHASNYQGHQQLQAAAALQAAGNGPLSARGPMTSLLPAIGSLASPATASPRQPGMAPAASSAAPAQQHMSPLQAFDAALPKTPSGLDHPSPSQPLYPPHPPHNNSMGALLAEGSEALVPSQVPIAAALVKQGSGGFIKRRSSFGGGGVLGGQHS